MSKKLGVLALAAFALNGLVGCATVKVQRERTAQVKTAAIIAFTGENAMGEDKDAPKNGVGDIINSVNSIKSLTSGEYDKAKQEQGNKAYELLRAKLEQALGWKVLSREELKKSDPYQKKLAEVGPVKIGHGWGYQTAENVLLAEDARQVDAATRNAFIQSLGVDAVAVARVKYVVGDKSGFAMGGIGKITRYPKAIVEFRLYDAKSEDPAWEDRWAEGEPTKEGFENTMGVQLTEKETEILTSAADSGFGKLVARYNEK